MGDIADHIIEEGFTQKALHEIGQCEYGCPYCLEEGEYGMPEEGE